MEMSNEYLLTIAVPTYNGSKTIGNMLDVLLPQVTEDVELFVIDNCSTDNTSQIITNYQKEYPFIQYYANKRNIGADGNFLLCMNKARGKYIYLLSDDDILTENSLQRILQFMKNSPDMGLIYLGTGNFRCKYENAESCEAPRMDPQKSICTQDKRIFMDYAKYFWGFVSSFIILRENFMKIQNPEQLH